MTASTGLGVAAAPAYISVAKLVDRTAAKQTHGSLHLGFQETERVLDAFRAEQIELP